MKLKAKSVWGDGDTDNAYSSIVIEVAVKMRKSLRGEDEGKDSSRIRKVGRMKVFVKQIMTENCGLSAK